ncbi:hypothetical protein [Agrobacterium tumefaciens]|uniref:Uncharacterized protein n=1 Tax=Agrobacterium tumefaciens TaxID=358 RepID=A0A176XHI6_AGRTU|nr:hypothetical protein [Agrobacterium tumefaciens]OAE48348.1 hypothetical protein A7J57_21925 [Agrobacterium tumefaciens]
MSKYYVNKFLYTVDRDPDLLRRYIDEPSSLVASWEQSVGPVLCGNAAELSTVHVLNEDERDALAGHDFVALFEMGAHFFLNLTIFIGVYDEPYMSRSGPLSFQREFARKLAHWKGRQYPSVAT